MKAWAEPAEGCRPADISGRLAVLRRHLALSEEEMARLLEMTVRTYREWERGRRVWRSVDLSVRIVRATAVSIDWLWTGALFGRERNDRIPLDPAGIPLEPIHMLLEEPLPASLRGTGKPAKRPRRAASKVVNLAEFRAAKEKAEAHGAAGRLLQAVNRLRETVIELQRLEGQANPDPHHAA